MSSINKGERVTRKGKTYVVISVAVDTIPRCGVDWTGQEVAQCRLAHPVTGKPYMQTRSFPVSELTKA